MQAGQEALDGQRAQGGDPRTGSTVLEMEPLDLVHAICQQIADPLLGPRCGVEMQVVACITEPAVIDAILRHRREAGLVSPFEARAPPAA